MVKKISQFLLGICCSLVIISLGSITTIAQEHDVLKVNYDETSDQIKIYCSSDNEQCEELLNGFTVAENNIVKIYDQNAVKPMIYQSLQQTINSDETEKNIVITKNDFSGITNETMLKDYVIHMLVMSEQSYWINCNKGDCKVEFMQAPPEIQGTYSDSEIALNCVDSAACNAWLNGYDIRVSGYRQSDNSQNFKIKAPNDDFSSDYTYEVDYTNNKISIRGDFTPYANDLNILVNTDGYMSYLYSSYNPDQGGQTGSGQGGNNPASRYKYIPYDTVITKEESGVKVACPIVSEGCEEYLNKINSLFLVQNIGAPLFLPLNETEISDDGTIKMLLVKKEFIENEIANQNVEMKYDDISSVQISALEYPQIVMGQETHYYPNNYEGCRIEKDEAINGTSYKVICDNDPLNIIGNISNISSLSLEYNRPDGTSDSFDMYGYVLDRDEKSIKFDIADYNKSFPSGDYTNVWLSIRSNTNDSKLKFEAIKQLNDFVVDESIIILRPPLVNVSYEYKKGLTIVCGANEDLNACSEYFNKIYDTADNTGKYVDEFTEVWLQRQGKPIWIPKRGDSGHPFEKIMNKETNITEALFVDAKWFNNLGQEDATYNGVEIKVPGYEKNSFPANITINLDLLDAKVTHNLTVKFEGLDLVIESNIRDKEEARKFYSSIDSLETGNAGTAPPTYKDAYLVFDEEKNSYKYILPYYEIQPFLGYFGNGTNSVILWFKGGIYRPAVFDAVQIENNIFKDAPADLRVYAVASGFIIETEDKGFLQSLITPSNDAKIQNSKLLLKTDRMGHSEVYSVSYDEYKFYKNENEDFVRVSIDKAGLEKLEYKGANLDVDETYYLTAYAPYYTGRNASSFSYKSSLKSIEFLSSINPGENQSVNELKKLDEMVKNLDGYNIQETINSNVDDVAINGIVASSISGDKEGNLNIKDIDTLEYYNTGIENNVIDINVSIQKSNDNVRANDLLDDYATKNELKGVKEIAFDVDVQKEYIKNSNKIDAYEVTALPYPVALTFEVPDSSKNYKLLREHDGEVTELPVSISGDNGIAYTDKFSSFMLVEYEEKGNTNLPNHSVNNSNNTWDDGGPFTTDVCGNIFDRWGNKIYSAPACQVNDGYQVPNTGVR